MFDIGWQELFILAVLAIIVVGPKDLPRAIRTVTQWIRKARAMARDLQDGLDDVVREAELEEIKKEANKIMDGDALDPTGALAKEFDMTDVQQDWSEAVEDLKAATDPNAKDGDAAPQDEEPLDDFADLDLDDDPDLDTEAAGASEPDGEPEPLTAEQPDAAPKKAEG